jgi:3',5'-cyclic AMP phosphodiesterase CpdA
MLKICHLSDLHLCGQNGQIRKAERTLNYAVNMGFDHLVITGDLVHYPKKRDFLQARSLFRDFGLLDGRKLSLTIGNHEIYGGVQFLKETLSFPQKSSTVDYKSKLLEFVNYFPEAFENTIRISDERPFPFIKTVDSFVLVGINSATPYSLFHNPLASNGKVSEEQLSALKILLNRPECSGKRKIVIIHHHFCKFRELRAKIELLKFRQMEMQTLKLFGKKALLAALAGHGVELVLHGHVHKSIRYNKHGIVFSNAGGSIDGWDSYKLAINLITIGDREIEVKIHPFSTAEGPETERIYDDSFMPGFAGQT